MNVCYCCCWAGGGIEECDQGIPGQSAPAGPQEETGGGQGAGKGGRWGDLGPREGDWGPQGGDLGPRGGPLQEEEEDLMRMPRYCFSRCIRTLFMMNNEFTFREL